VTAFAVTCAAGLLINAGTPGAWVQTIGDGDLPPVPAHMTVIHEQSGPGWWYRSGTIGLGNYTTLLDIAEGQTVHVQFVEGPVITFRCWSPPDADGSGWVDSNDTSHFLGDWLNGRGDYDGNFVSNSDDIAAYLAAWLDGRG
jgi:hypothetical protein